MVSISCWARHWAFSACLLLAAFAALTAEGRGNVSLSATHRRLTTKLEENLCLNRPVSISSVNSVTREVPGTILTETFSGDASKLNDGDTGTDFFAGQGCSESLVQPDPWARIDFEREVPVAEVQIWTRYDAGENSLYPIELYVGSSASSFSQNILCASNIELDRNNPVAVTCVQPGRYLWIVLRRSGTFSGYLSLCEVMATPKGPAGTLHMLAVASQMFDLTLDGIALEPHDRIRIVDDDIYCGRTGSKDMDAAVLPLTSPEGERTTGDYVTETWRYIHIKRAGLYKVCWCGGYGACSVDEEYSQHVATIVVNGEMVTLAGTGSEPASPSDIVDGQPGLATPLFQPTGVAIDGTRVFFSETAGHRVRYVDLSSGVVSVLAGVAAHPPVAGYAGDGLPAQQSELASPMGLALSPDHQVLYIADAASHRIRQVSVGGFTKPELGTISTIAGNGYRGFSGDGGPANEAQLSYPSDVTVDLNYFLWICDTGNNRIRVVSLDLQVLVPGTTDYVSGIILTAAGNGQSASSDNIGNGGQAVLAQVGNPVAIAASTGYINADVGDLTASVFIAEDIPNRVRGMSVEFESYLGEIRNIAGTGERGSELDEASPNAANLAELAVPSGVAANDGMLYVSDSANNRLLMLPVLEYASLGCWREDISAPHIVSIEPGDGGEENSYLDGPPEVRTNAVYKCAKATLARGYTVFALRQMGACCTSETAGISYQLEGASTSCADGKGGSRDNSVYQLIRPGMMVEQLEIIYVMAGRSGTPGYSTGDVNTWSQLLNYPTGLGTNPVTGDLVIADSNNHRLQMLFHQVGPDGTQELTCTQGSDCKATVSGNGLFETLRAAVIPYSSVCGAPDLDFMSEALGFATNPAAADAASAYTSKTFSFGLTNASHSGDFRICLCTVGDTVMGSATTCSESWSFIVEVGTVFVKGPNTVTTQHARAGTKFNLVIYGGGLSRFDRIRVLRYEESCGEFGANYSAPEVHDPPQFGDVLLESANPQENLHGQRMHGNSSYSLWDEVIIDDPGMYRVCWCEGVMEDGLTQQECSTADRFNFAASTIFVQGPAHYNGSVRMDFGADLAVLGTGLGAGDRIRLVEGDVECGTSDAAAFTGAVDGGAVVPDGPANRVSPSRGVWSGVKLRRSGPFKVCWCGKMDGCASGEDFNIEAATLTTLGPQNKPLEKYGVLPGELFDLILPGAGYTGDERIRVVNFETDCAAPGASAMDSNVAAETAPSGAGTISSEADTLAWENVSITTVGKYRVCYCPSGACTLDSDFFIEAAMVFVDESLDSYNGSTYFAPASSLDQKFVTRQPHQWGLVTKADLKNVSVIAKTRDTPAQSKTSGRIHVQLYDTSGATFGDPIELSEMGAGSTVVKTLLQVLDLDAVPSYIRVRAIDSDAWFCEYIDVYVDFYGWNRFQCDGWAVREGAAEHREARRITDETLEPLWMSTYSPHVSVAMWETRYMQLDLCGGCPLGMACVQESQPLEDQLAWEGTVDPYSHQPSSAFRARCRPVCGDGLATHGEQCDDGNTDSLDGCSGQCQVEHGFECVNNDRNPSRCYPQFCDETVATSGVGGYTTALFEKGGDIGFMCSAALPYELNAPPDKPFLCYPWSASLCPAELDLLAPTPYQFRPESEARVDCAVWEMHNEGNGILCSGSPPTYDPPLGELGYVSEAQCAEDCYLDLLCNSSRFYIHTVSGGSECSAGLSPGVCGSHCAHLHDCETLAANPDAGLSQSDDTYYVSRKLLKTEDEVDGDYACSMLHQPRPVWAQELEGNIMVQFDSKVAMPVIDGVTVTRDFSCGVLLTLACFNLVGGEASSCSWVAADVLRITLGPEANINRVDRVDNASQLFGDPGIVTFDSRKVLPLGIPRDYWKDDPAQEFEVFVRRADPYTGREGAKPKFPEVVLRGPEIFGACGPIDVFADASVMGGGRRWKSAVWTCVESRPEYATTPVEESASDVQKAGYDRCRDTIQPYLDDAAWCGDEPYLGVVRVCNLRASIPESLWCGLSLIRLRLTLTSAEGFSSSAEWTTRLSARVASRSPPGHAYPTVTPAGPTTVLVPAQREPGGPFPRLTLEIRTYSDPTNSICDCNQSAPLKAQDMGGIVYVKWYYGEVVNGRQPALYEMDAITVDEAELPNVLQFPMQGRVMNPGSHWRFLARAAYPSQYVLDEGADVSFQVHIGPLEPPSVNIKAPHRVCGRLCSVVVDASESKIRELLYWDGSDGSRRMQAIAQELSFEWECRQLGGGNDDALPRTVPDAEDLIPICTQKVPTLTIPQGALPYGLYLFTVIVTDSAYPSIPGRANVTVDITSDAAPAFFVEGPPPMLRRDQAAQITVTQMGFGPCPVPPDANGAMLLLMRTVAGRMIGTMRVVAILTLRKGSITFDDKVGIVYEGEALAKLLEAGFMYTLRFVYTNVDSTILPAYEATLRAAGVELDPPDTYRLVPSTPPLLPDGAAKLDTEPFGVYSGPSAGTLLVMSPRYMKGMAMTDIFALQQVWASDYGPLQYSYWYSKVPESERDAFEHAVSLSDSNASMRLMSLVTPESFQVLTSWSLDPTISTPLPVGLYIVEGRVVDQNGMEASLAVGLEALPSRSPNATNAYEYLEALDRYVNESRQAILQVRSVNRAAISVLTVSSAVNSMPDFAIYDWYTMTVWNVTSGIPDPTTTMRPYDTPIVSTALRDKTLAYLSEVSDTLYDIIMYSDDSAFADPLSSGRRLQGSLTDTAVQAVASALRALAEGIAPVLHPELFVSIGDLVVRLLQRVRDARSDISTHVGADQDVMSTLAALLGNTKPIPMPRDGNVDLNPEVIVDDPDVDAVVYVNISDQWEARLTASITAGMEQLADAISAWRANDEEVELLAELPPGTMPEGDHHGGGPLRLTVLTRSLTDVMDYGVMLLPNYQQVERWPYPKVLIHPLGEPGFELGNWAGSNPPRYNPQCYNELESFGQRITTVLVSWPFNPMRYSSGTMVGITTNVSNAYSVLLRSCGESIVVDEMVGMVEVTVRIPPAIVRDRRWGYHGSIPYRISWWEDIMGVGGASTRIRRWTTQGCRTQWVITQEDLVDGICDRLPQRDPGGVYAVELAPRPAYVVEAPAVVNTSFHNLITYTLILLVIRWLFLMYWATQGDRNFWPSEKNRMRIHFVPAQLQWLLLVKAGRVEPYDPDARYIWKKAFWRAALRNKLKMLKKAVVTCQILSGDTRMTSLEVRELRAMREGRRDEVYENHLDTREDDDAKQRSKQLVAALEAPPDVLLASLPEPLQHGWGDDGEKADSGLDMPIEFVEEEEPFLDDANIDLEQQQQQEEEDYGANGMPVFEGPEIRDGPAYKGSGDGGDDADYHGAGYEYEMIEEPPARREVKDLSMIEAQYDEVADADEEVDMTVLPDNWAKAYSLEFNKPYYYNKVTFQTLWEFPTPERLEALKVKKIRPGGKLGGLKKSAEQYRSLRAPAVPLPDMENQALPPPRVLPDPEHRAAPPAERRDIAEGASPASSSSACFSALRTSGTAVAGSSDRGAVLQAHDVEDPTRRQMIRMQRDPCHAAPPHPRHIQPRQSPSGSGGGQAQESRLGPSSSSCSSSSSSKCRIAWGEGSGDTCAAPHIVSHFRRDEVVHASPPGGEKQRGPLALADEPNFTTMADGQLGLAQLVLAPLTEGLVLAPPSEDVASSELLGVSDEEKHPGLDMRLHHDSADLVRLRLGDSYRLMENSKDVELPAGWVRHETDKGDAYYVNAKARITQWSLPRLPPQWEERNSTSQPGEVYYLNLFDGTRQWNWPHEPEWNASYAQRTWGGSGTPGAGPAKRFLALPGCPDRDGDDEEEAEEGHQDDTGISLALQLEATAVGVDTVDPSVLLALPRLPAPGFIASPLPSSSAIAKPETKKNPVKWGVDPKEAEWLELKKQLQEQRKAQDVRFDAANTFPGVRSFVRPHEMADQMNNWERQLDNVTMKRDAWERRNLALGHRAELRKKELRNLFPVIQRLQWTKWSGGQIFYHCLMRSLPSQRMYLNFYPSPKRCRCLLSILSVSVVLLCSMIVLCWEAPVDEEVEADDRAPWELLDEAFTSEWDANVFIIAASAAVLGRWCRLFLVSIFFSYTVPMHQPPPEKLRARRVQMRYWHEFSETGKWVCLVASVLCVGASLVLCSLLPQPRSSMAFRIFFITIMVTHIVGPVLSAIGATIVLTLARGGRMFDPLLTAFPGIMDFISVGVVTPEFYAWRCQRIVSEEEMMAEVHGHGMFLG